MFVNELCHIPPHPGILASRRSPPDLALPEVKASAVGCLLLLLLLLLLSDLLNAGITKVEK